MDDADPAVVALWEEYVASAGAQGPLRGGFAFGDSPELADELAALVVVGTKRATATLLADFEHDGEALPRVGEHWVVQDGVGRPRCVIRTTRVDLKPFDAVDADDARDEGEDDGTLAAWVAGHRRFFGRRCAALGIDFTDDITVVFERFEQVWPARGADSPPG
jgi:uncharacterized protein YhfF